MAESIKKFIIKDAHGGTKEQGSFSVVGEVHVNLVPGYGEPYAESEYVDGVLTITIHNIEGNGITEITTDSQEGDEAVNTVTIKTNDNPEGVTLQVRNGSRGNGIASSSEVLSPDDGGINTHTIVDTDGNEHVFHTKNGRKGDKGDQGDSAVYDPSAPDVPDFVMANTMGQSTTKAMTQKAVTNELVKDDVVFDLSKFNKLQYWINNDGNWVSNSNCNSCLINVRPGDMLFLKANDNINISYAFLVSDNHTETIPAYAGGTSACANVSRGKEEMVIVPNDATLLYILLNIGTSNFTPTKVAKLIKVGEMVEDAKEWADELLLDDLGIVQTDKYAFLDNNTFGGGSSLRHAVIPVREGEKYVVEWNASTQNGVTTIIFATSNACTDGGEIPIVDGTSPVYVSYIEKEKIVTIPSGCAYLLIYNAGAVPTFKVKKQHGCSSEGNQDIEVFYQSILDERINYNSGIVESTASFWPNCMRTDYVCVEGLPYIIYQRLFLTDESNNGMAFYDANKVFISGSGQRFGVTTGSSYWEPTKLSVPANAKYARFTIGNDATGFWIKVPKITKGEKSTIIPQLDFDTISTIGTNVATSYNGKKVLTTPRFVKTNSEFYVNSSKAMRLRVHYYDKDFSICGYSPNSDLYQIPANEPTKIKVTHDTEYVKLSFYDAEDFVDIDVIPNIKLTGIFPVEWDVFNVRPSDAGYQRIITRVWVTDPNCCDNDTGEVQDNGEWLEDYGILAIPPSYSNTGKPTRLIIYCHGAAVNYADTVTRFNSTDLQPQYWLKEGYAVMDVEGNPFDNTNEHICMPQAMDCYVAAYKWVIEHFNICRNGVFIGGRSMGGMNVFNLIRRECPIPVIAACPNVPASESFGYSNKDRKEFLSEHMGFILPEGFTWSNGGLTSQELDVIEDNWDKWVKCVPIYNICTDLPSKEIMMNMWRNNTRTSLLSTLHAIVKCPVKLFGCHEDLNCPPEITSALYYRMLINSGQIVELRLFHTFKDYGGNTEGPHHYDTLDEALRTTVTTRYGEEASDVPVVYVEMLRFWRRYEQDEL